MIIELQSLFGKGGGGERRQGKGLGLEEMNRTPSLCLTRASNPAEPSRYLPPRKRDIQRAGLKEGDTAPYRIKQGIASPLKPCKDPGSVT